MSKFSVGAAIAFGLLVILMVLTGISLSRKEANTEAALQKEIQDIKAAKVKARMDKLRNEIDANYTKAMSYMKDGKHYLALPLFKDVEEANPDYKDLKKQMQLAISLRGEAARNERKSQAARLFNQAIQQAKSHSCSEVKAAETSWNKAIALDASQRPVGPDSLDLQRIREELLRCSEGNSDLSMAIQIQRRKPVTLYVWIKNLSRRVRHANPNYFTLVTDNSESHPYSPLTFEYSKSFPAVELQPGTEASGMLVFGTNQAPRKLIYQEMLGSQVSREFPQ